ncbi:NADPh quinone reductase [Mortierella sp. 14UC]|nr:NADPh quinone reductase [Mortierella sp. 14UC]
MTDTSGLPKTYKSIQWTTPSLDPKEILSLNTSTPLPNVTGSNILVKVHAAALNPVDWKLMRGGVPRLLMPKIKVPGLDISGTVVAVGPKAKKEGGFKVGDEVVAMLSFSQSGALTEYTIVNQAYLARKPERWTHEQAAAWPLVATTVWQALVVRGNLKKGDKILINGASGGTGTVGVQIAKALGAYVVGVCSTDNVQLVKDLGADEVVDYKKEDVTVKYTNQDFDLIFDTVGSAAEIWAKNATILKPSGNLVRIAGPDNAMDTPFTFLQAGAQIGFNKVSSFLKRGPGYHLFTTFPDGAVLIKAINVLDEVNADPVIDSVYEFTLPSVLAAFDKSKSHRAKGKIVIKIA